ncbi:MAG: DUF4367 domain-containing protein [Terrisporobacter sp.]
MDNLDITDEMIYKSCKKLEQNLLDNLPNEVDIEYEFSSKFKRKMNKLIKYEKRSPIINSIYKYSKKIAIVFLIITMGLFTLSMSVEATRTKVINTITEIYEEFTSIIFSKENTNISIDQEFKPTLPNYIPNGFNEIDKVESDIGIFIVYENDEYLQIRYSCDEISNNSIILDTEDAQVEDIKINGYDAKYIVKDNIQQLVWNDNISSYLIDMESKTSKLINNDKEELINMAESIK